MADRAEIPPHIRPYVDVLGEEGAVEFLLKFGGGMLYIADQPQGNSKAVRAVGRDKVKKLAAALGSNLTRVPTGKPFIAAHFHARNWSVQDIARKLHMTDFAVRRWLRRKDAGQLSLDI